MAPALRLFSSIHQSPRRIFSKTLDMNLELTLAKKITAFFTFLSELDLGLKHFFDQLTSLDINHPHFVQVISWAQYILATLSSLPPVINIGFPSNDGYHVCIISCKKDWIYRGTSFDGLYGTCKMLFDDVLEEKGLREKKLNPNAKEWCPADVREESRSLFITFSKCLPLTYNEIRLFFTWCYGPYVEKIYVHRRGSGGSPLFGNIVFKFSCVPFYILNGRDEVQFMINGKTLRCKKYLRRIRPD